MSRLTDLVQAAKRLDPQLGADLEAEIAPLQERLPFGLNFERHRPEAVELPGQQIRQGSKVRMLPPRGSALPGDSRIWSVDSVAGGMASLTERGVAVPQTVWYPVDDLVTIAEFRDPIYPGLTPTGKINRGGPKPSHTVISGENFHVLETLLFTHAGRVDAIYIDPPYNTGARDWKYNNDYVAADDLYRHSKWLAFMERRLKLAGKLLNPNESVLIVTVDEKEYLRLGLLLEQIFPQAAIQAVSVAINPAAVARKGFFSRSDEFYYFVMFGAAGVTPIPLARDWITSKGRTHGGEIRWDLLRKSGSSPTRSGHPGTFYPLVASADANHILRIGDPIGEGRPRASYRAQEGELLLWPIRDDGSEGRWAVGPVVAREMLTQGYLKLGKAKGESTPVYYLARGEQQKIMDGVYAVTGRNSDGSVATTSLDSDTRRIVPSTQWRIGAHDSTQYGSRLVASLIPGRKFPYPKSLYAVEDALRFFVAKKPDATVIDFFAGSGTTAHAVMRLNRQDGGKRQCILVTNNEVSADEQRGLREKGLRPGDEDWESHGICDYITKPRIEAAITGHTPTGTPIPGNYKFIDEFPIGAGLEENADFFTLTYESPYRVAADRAFASIAPMLWLRAGAEGRRIDSLIDGWDISESYGILRDLDQATPFLRAVRAASSLRIVYVITDDERRYQLVTSELPEHVERARLYEDYLLNFAIVTDY